METLRKVIFGYRLKFLLSEFPQAVIVRTNIVRSVMSVEGIILKDYKDYLYIN